MNQIKMGVVADDVTGSNDIGIMFAKAGYATHVYSIDEAGRFRLDADPQPDVCILDTNSRLDPPDLAYRKVFDATRLLQEAGCQQFYNKTCSVFRGNIGAEFDAMLDALGQQFAILVLGFPKNGRRTIDGIHYVHGKPLAESEFRNDPVHPMTESNLVDILRSQTHRAVALLDHAVVARGVAPLRQAIAEMRDRCNYLLLDVSDQDALATIAQAAHDAPLLGGSSAIAEELAAFWGPPLSEARETELPRPGQAGVLCAAGSLMPQTRAQVEHLRQVGVTVLELSTTRLFDPDDRTAMLNALIGQIVREVARGRDVLFHASNLQDQIDATRRAGAAARLSKTEVARAVSESIAEVVARALEQTNLNRLVVAGGETSSAVCRKLGVSGLRIWREIQPGLPSCVTLTPPHRWLVLKSGSFGSADFLERAIEHLRSL